MYIYNILLFKVFVEGFFFLVRVYVVFDEIEKSFEYEIEWESRKFLKFEIGKYVLWKNLLKIINNNLNVVVWFK